MLVSHTTQTSWFMLSRRTKGWEVLRLNRNYETKITFLVLLEILSAITCISFNIHIAWDAMKIPQSSYFWGMQGKGTEKDIRRKCLGSTAVTEFKGTQQRPIRQRKSQFTKLHLILFSFSILWFIHFRSAQKSKTVFQL